MTRVLNQITEISGTDLVPPRINQSLTHLKKKTIIYPYWAVTYRMIPEPLSVPDSMWLRHLGCL